MKTTRFFLAALTLAMLHLAIPHVLALTIQEGFQVTDFPNSAEAADTYVLDVGGNDFVGASSGSDSDYFKVTVLPGRKITAIQTTGSASHALSLPLYAGTYQFVVGNVLPGNEAWGFTFTVAAGEDYSVDTTGVQLVVTDRSGNGDTLTVSQPFAGTVQFAAPGRTFSLNGAAFTTGNSSIISHGTSPIVVNAGAGSDTINVGDFSQSFGSFPSLIIRGGAGDDVVNFTGDLIMATGRFLEIAEADAGTPTMETVNVAAGANVRVPGPSITIVCARNIAIETGGSLEGSTGASVILTANMQATPATGNFTGVRVNGGTISSVYGPVTVTGRGGNAAGGAQLGVEVTNGGQITTSGIGAMVTVTGTGGDNTGLVNRGVTVSGAGSEIRSGNGPVTVSGTGGPNGGYFGIGVSVLSGGVIAGGAFGDSSVTGTGAGAGGFNLGVELGAGTITTTGGHLSVTGRAGVGGDSVGIFVNNGSAISTPADGGNILIRTDSLAIDGTSSISAAHPAGDISLRPDTNSIVLDLGGENAPGRLGLSDAKLDRVFASTLTFQSSGSGVEITAPITRATATDVRVFNDAIRASGSGTDLSLAGGTLVLFNGLSMPIIGPAADSGYPQLNVAGAVNLSSVALDLTGTTFAGVAGNTFTLVENDGTDPIFGAFAGLPEGAIFAWPGSPLLNARISYVGGSGNDVVLTLVNPLEVTNTNSSGFGSLGDALAYAASLPGANTINFHPSLSGAAFGAVPYAVNDPGVVILDASALPDGVTFDGSQDYQLFTNASGSSLTLRRLTLTKGHSGVGGGAIANDGTLTLEQCALHANRAFTGGAIFNQGTLTLTGCTLRNNVATSWGGAIDNVGTLTLTRCTLASNSATGASGGAIFHDEEAITLTLTHCTLAGNASQGSSGGAISADAPLALHYCLVAGNSGSAIFASSSFTDIQSHITSSAALLAPLGDYGGPTQTIALLPGHAAREAATSSTSTSDQRGVPIVGLPDIGAYETGIPRNYAAWHYETLPATATLAERAPGFDYDGDGRLNVLEYATFTDGAVPGGSTGTTFLRLPDGSEARFTFLVRTTATDLLYELQRSLPGVGPWVTIGDVNLRTGVIHNYGVGVTNLPSLFSIEFRDPGIAGQGKAFYRLQVSVP